jgi:hypothetical protein
MPSMVSRASETTGQGSKKRENDMEMVERRREHATKQAGTPAPFSGHRNRKRVLSGLQSPSGR